MEKRFRVGVIGGGRIGTRRARIAAAHLSSDLVVVADQDEAKARALAAELDCEGTSDWQSVARRDDLDIVVISLPTALLAPVSTEALHFGKHVLCEKPLGRSPQEVAALVETARSANRTLKAGFNLRHHPAIATARRLVAEGAIGDTAFVRSRYGHTGRVGYESDWRLDPRMTGGGELLDQGIHVVDLLRWFLGEPAQVTGFVTTVYWETSLEDNAFALFKTERGQVASLHASWTQWRNLFSFEVFGKDGYLIVEGLGGSYGPERLIRGWKAAPHEWPPREEVQPFGGPEACWEEEWEEFLAALQEGREPLGSGMDGLRAIELVFAIYEAATTGRTVNIGTGEEVTTSHG